MRRTVLRQALRQAQEASQDRLLVVRQPVGNNPVQSTFCCPFTPATTSPEAINTRQFLYELIALLLAENTRLSGEKDKMAEALDQLQHLNRDKSKLFSLISHDLRGPFTTLKGFSYLLWQELNSEAGVPEDAKMMARSIYNSSEAIFNLLEILLAWSRLQLGRMVYRPVKARVPQVVDLALAPLAQMAEAKQIKLANNTPNLLVCIDENMIEAVLRNLISNAIKFTPPAGRVSILARLSDAPRWVEVEVRDSGIGISPEDQARLFDSDGPAQTTPGTQKEKGTGLGLMLCREMVEKHGGTIWVESAPGQGTGIIFTIPQARL